MKKGNSERIKKWREHIEAAESSPIGVAGYCRSQGIHTSSFYTWKRKLARLNSASSEATFLPMVVSVPTAAPEAVQINLPDPSWVAEIMAQLVRRLS